MICRVHGVLEELGDGMARVDTGHGLMYEILVPAFAQARFGVDIGRPITLYTVHYLEGTSQGSQFTPRLAGFPESKDLAFFKLFTSVKGIGPRESRAMSLSTLQIAAAIADRDVKLLQTLPEVGKRTAETIVAELHGKVDRFLSGEQVAGGRSHSSVAPASSAEREALEVMLQLGETRAAAMNWVDEAHRRHPDADVQTLIREAFVIKNGG